MYEDREKGLHLALKAVLSVAQKKGLNLDGLTEAVADELLQYKSYDSQHVPTAIKEIELAVDALLV
ncbi:hypothetical protein [Pseudomonas sp. W5-36]|uniref:hypothetical protein n=1 Tax=Pseudomonas sp. W5-36 TaxID=3097455 RepID=UPI00397C028F